MFVYLLYSCIIGFVYDHMVLWAFVWGCDGGMNFFPHKLQKVYIIVLLCKQIYIVWFCEVFAVSRQFEVRNR